MLPPYLDRLDNARQEVFKKLAHFRDAFVLAGGTAIALQLGHRESYDFDCFSEKKLSSTLFAKTKRAFGAETSLLLRNTDEMLFVMTPEQVEINFVSYPYPRLKPPVDTGGIGLFHLDDLVSNKAFTLGRRPQWRDYVDLFFCMKWDIYTLDAIIFLSEKKFGGEFNVKLFLGQLTYFEDVKVRPTVFLKESYTPEEIKGYIAAQVRAYLATVLPG